MLISVIMPNYNGGCHIESSILSVFKQTFSNWELIFVDDCSTDNSTSIIEKYSRNDDRIKCEKLNSNSGTPGVPRNIGLNQSKGDYIAFLDSDDIWHPQKLEIQLNYMLKNKSVFSFTKILPFKNEKKIIGKQNKHLSHETNKIQSKKINHSILLRKNFVKSCSTALVKNNIIGKLRFNNDPSFKAVEDYLFWLDILKFNCKYAHWLNIPTTYYRESHTSISKSKSFMIKQNYKLYNHIFQKQPNKWLKVASHMSTYAYYSSRNIIKSKTSKGF